MLDLDKFKGVNDTMGHAAGDQLLVEVGKCLEALMRLRDTVARLGGDEFGIVGYDIREAADADRTAERIITEIHRPFMIQGHSVEISVSIATIRRAGHPAGAAARAQLGILVNVDHFGQGFVQAQSDLRTKTQQDQDSRQAL